MARHVLIISGLQIFPAESGGQIRTASIAEAFAANGDDTTIYSYTGRKRDYLGMRKSSHQTIAKGISEYVNRNPLYGLTQFLFYKMNFPPVWLTLLSRWCIPKVLKMFMRHADVLIIDFPFLYPAAISSHNKYILNTHNVEANLYARRGSEKIKRSLVGYIERNAVRNASSVLFCINRDKEYFESCYKLNNDKAIIIPNGVNLARIEKVLNNGDKYEIRNKLGISMKTILILFSGSSYRPNTEAFDFIKEFCQHHLSLLRTLDIKFLIVGTVAATAASTDFYLSTGRVDDVYPYFAACDAAINPIVSGSGSNIKMSEYIAFRLPIFTTSFGARGFNLQDGLSCFYFDLSNLKSVLLKAFKENKQNRTYAMAKQAFDDNLRLIDIKENMRRTL
ncbi:MAG: glycosyltransferase family 4 protein [Bdellovibrio sp.]|nr:glycosyltransferase family 4 protein [Bdellovibrio sp.]